MNRKKIAISLSVATLVLALGVTILLNPQGFTITTAETQINTTSMPRYTAGNLELAIAINPEAPRVGDNTVVIELRDQDGNPVTDVNIEANAEMAAMGAMAAMRAPADLKQTQPGRYEGDFTLSMRGEWPLTIHIEDTQGGQQRLLFDLATDRSGVEIAAGGSKINTSPTDTKDTKNNTSIPRFTAGDVEIAIETQPAIPRVGDNTVVIELRDQQGNPITGVDIEANAEMAAMGAMAAMRAPAGMQEVSPGRYEGEVNLSMRGEWPLTVNIKDTERGERRLLFDFATDRAGLEIASGGTPIGGPATTVDTENAIRVDNRRRQLIGVKTGKVSRREMTKDIRAVGEVAYDERLLSHVTLKFNGFIGDLKANYVGIPIEQNQVLFTVYSPELLAAQQEYLETRKRRGSRTKNDPLLRAARQRLALWDMGANDIRALERRGSPESYVAIRAPRSGTLIDSTIVDGSAAPMGKMLLSIADLSQVWIEADVFEADLDLVKVGMPVTVSLPYLPGRRYESTVEYVYPYLQEKSRTGRIRLTLDNTDGQLKPDMYANVALHVELGNKLSVPEDAVIVAGKNRIVFVDLGDGRLNPVRIKTGRQAGGFIEVLEGLNPDDIVVTSGNFLIAAEAKLKTGIKQW